MKYFEDRNFKSDGINDNTYNLLFQDDIESSISDYDYAKALVTIDTFTKVKNKLDYIKYRDRLIYASRIKHKKDYIYEYNYEDISIPFMKISDVIKSKECKDELLSDKRYGKCHDRSLLLSQLISDSIILTGRTCISNKVFHSVVLKDNYIYDWTRNLIVNKEDYMKLTKFQVLSSIKSSDIPSDLEYIAGNLPISIPIYFLFRDEIINDIMKNESMYTKTFRKK